MYATIISLVVLVLPITALFIHAKYFGKSTNWTEIPSFVYTKKRGDADTYKIGIFEL